MGLPLLIAVAAVAVAAQGPSSTRLRVEYLDSPLTIDVARPRFSWALVHPSRGQTITSYRIIVTNAATTAWDSGIVTSNTSLNIEYGGSPLIEDTDYSWNVTWTDASGAASTPAIGRFSTALLTPASWRGAEWVSAAPQSRNVYRVEFNLPAQVLRARLFITGLGYAKTWLNGALTDDHELGSFTTFQRRTLYEVYDVTSQLHIGCNALAVALGAGWWSEPSINAGVRQFRLVLSVTSAAGGSPTYYVSANAPGATGALVFTAAVGPVTSDNIYDGETYDGRIAAALAGWQSCGFAPAPGVWSATSAPATSPSTFNATISAHGVLIKTDRTYSVVAGGISQPSPGVYVFDMGQNMAGQTTLRVENCPVGTKITLIHNEILNADGTVNRNLAKMEGVYICAGNGGIEEYRTLFTYYGFRYVQVEGFPGVPGEEAVTAHFVHSDVPQSGEFTSSSALLNAIQHATRYASWSNLMDVPTDCPQRERRGWLGDAQLSLETVIHNVDGGGFYTKWLNDFADTQVYDNADGALPDCIPFYGHGNTDSDPGWGIAAWTITDWFSDYYADDVFDVAWYPNMRLYMEHWIKVAEANNGMFNIFHWGDWANYVPGPYGFQTPEYPQFFYITALEITAKFAARLGQASDVTRYSTLATSARALYQSTYFNATTNCYAGCTYVSQVFALTLGLAGPQGSATERAVWAHAMDWWSANATKGVPEHFGGGIISLKYSLPLLDAHGETGLALKMHLQTDKAPGFGYWIETGHATTLWEQYDMTDTVGGASRNHIMFGAAGSWYYSTLAGLGRAKGSRSWQRLSITPPSSPALLAQLSSASASIDSAMGAVASGWATPAKPAVGSVCATAPENAVLNMTCRKSTFSGVAFASFGTPTGTCSTGLAVNPSCNAATSRSVVIAACVGKSSCTLTASNDAFGGDPCLNTVKHLAVALDGDCGFSYTITTTVPVGATAAVTVPTLGTSPATATISEGTSKVWSSGAFVPGVPGVRAAAVGDDGASVIFEVGSGTYDFVVSS